MALWFGLQTSHIAKVVKSAVASPPSTVVYRHWTGGLDRWTGLVDWTGGLTFFMLKSLVCPLMKPRSHVGLVLRPFSLY